MKRRQPMDMGNAAVWIIRIVTILIVLAGGVIGWLIGKFL